MTNRIHPNFKINYVNCPKCGGDNTQFMDDDEAVSTWFYCWDCKIIYDLEDGSW